MKSEKGWATVAVKLAAMSNHTRTAPRQSKKRGGKSIIAGQREKPENKTARTIYRPPSSPSSLPLPLEDDEDADATDAPGVYTSSRSAPT